jgi:hypothetical protein
MSARDERRAQMARQRLVEALSEPGGSLPGRLLERTLRCGKENCACKADPPELHGPYVQWGYSQGGKKRTRWLSADQVALYEPQLARGRRLKELMAALEEAEIRRVERAEGWRT